MKKGDMKQEFRVHEYYERTGPIKQSSEDAAEAYKKMLINDRIIYRSQLKKQIIESRYFLFKFSMTFSKKDII